MVSTRQMSTSLSSNTNTGNVSDGETMHRLSVITRQAASSNNIITNSGSGSSSTSRSITNGYSQQNLPEATNVIPLTNRSSQDILLLDLPLEILDKIFSYISYKKVGQMRVISHKMNDICMGVLNSTFSKLITQMANRFQNVKAKMPRRESARRNHPLACECDIIETCYMRLSLLQMTFGKHIERKHCCFFPGGILDEVYNVLNYIRNTPRLEKPYRVTDELFDLSTMAMEYFKDYIEPNLPDIAYFNKDYFDLPTSKRPSSSSLKISIDLSDSSTNMPSPPQSNMVLRKGIRKIKQGMKMYNNQLSVLRSELRNCKRKSSEQGKQIAEQQKLLAEQQKQALEYANRLDENDKKNEEMARKFSTLLQELNKCKTELQYWRSKSPATPMCLSCGQKMTPILPPEDYQALVNQGVNPEDININIDDADESYTNNNVSLSTEFAFPDETTTAKLIAINSVSKHLKRQYSNSSNTYCSGNINSISRNQFQCSNIEIGSNESVVNFENLTSKRNETLPHGFINTNDLNSEVQRNSSNQSCGSSGWFKTDVNVNHDNSETTECGINLPFRNSDKASSTSNFTGNILQQISANENANAFDDGQTVDVASLNLIANNETKKARRVQKNGRCHNIGSNKRK